MCPLTQQVARGFGCEHTGLGRIPVLQTKVDIHRLVEYSGQAQKVTRGCVPTSGTPRPSFTHHNGSRVGGELCLGAKDITRRTRMGYQGFSLDKGPQCCWNHFKNRTAKLEGKPRREPAQQESPSLSASPPKVATRLPPKSKTSTRAMLGVACDTASRVVEAATPSGLGRSDTHTWVIRNAHKGNNCDHNR